MSTNVPEHLKKYEKLFQEHMQSVDKFGQVILNGHLIIESVLDNILDLVFFNSNRVRDARLGFNQKVQLARGIALRKDDLEPWTLILSVNAVRNEISHNLAGERRTKKVEQLKRLYSAGARPEIQQTLKDAPDEVFGYYACLECVGFLGTLEHDTQALRQHIDALDSVLSEVRKKAGGDNRPKVK